MRSPVTSKSGAETLQEFTDRAITDPDELAALSQKLKRPAGQLRALWVAGVAVALVVGILLGWLLLR